VDLPRLEAELAQGSLGVRREDRGPPSLISQLCRQSAGRIAWKAQVAGAASYRLRAAPQRRLSIALLSLCSAACAELAARTAAGDGRLCNTSIDLE